MVQDVDKFDFFAKIIAQNTPVAYIILDLDYNIVYCNNYTVEMVGTRISEIVGSKCYEIVNKGTRCDKCAVRETHISLKKEVVNKREIDKFGNFRYNEIHSVPVFDDDSNLIYIMEILMDRTKEVLLQKKSDEAFMALVDTMSYLLEARDDYTAFHSANVKHYSIQMGDFLQLSEQEKRNIFIASSLHDIGKVGIRDHVILKEGKLTDEEYEIIKQHPLIGGNILSKIKHFDEIAVIVKYHHERIDGKGYPEGLKASEIPFLSKIICIADAFDAMTTDRPYRKALSAEIAMAELQKYSGTQFDEQLCEVFVHLVKNKIIKIIKR